MADLLTHVLVPFVFLTALRWRIDRLARRWIPVAMGGAVVPDLGKLELVLDDAVVESVVGVPFAWTAVETVGGVVVVSAAIAVWFGSDRLVAYGWLVFGGVSALVLDGLRVSADGFAGFWVYPVWWRPPTPNLYVSADYRVTAIAVVLAVGVLVLDRRISESAP